MVQVEVKLANGKIVEWTGETPEEACEKAADCLGEPAIAWRYPRYEFVAGVHHSQIIG